MQNNQLSTKSHIELKITLINHQLLGLRLLILFKNGIAMLYWFTNLYDTAPFACSYSMTVGLLYSMSTNITTSPDTPSFNCVWHNGGQQWFSRLKEVTSQSTLDFGILKILIYIRKPATNLTSLGLRPNICLLSPKRFHKVYWNHFIQLNTRVKNGVTTILIS